MTQPLSPVPTNVSPPTRITPEQSAWLILTAFFVAALILLAWLLQLAWYGYVDAMRSQDGAMLRGHVVSGVLLQEPRSLTSHTIERLPAAVDPCQNQSDICAPLTIGDRIKTLPAAGYGPVASLVLPDTTHIQLWAQGTGSDIVYRTNQVSRWSHRRQVVNLVQNAGYARYDIAQYQPFDSVEYSVSLANQVTVWMSPGGSYSINVIPDDAALNNPIQFEVAVRSGTATVQRGAVTEGVSAGEIVEVSDDNQIHKARIATWQLIRDPQWQTVVRELRDDDRYNWREFQRADAPNLSSAEKNGRLEVSMGCRPERPDFCSADDQVRILRFRRDGNQIRPFAVGIDQTLDADVSEYTSLRLTAWVRVLTQTVPLAGIAGSECPVMFQLTFKTISPTDKQQERTFCLYAFKSSESLVQDSGDIRYRALPPFQWYRLDVDLREDEFLRYARYLQSIRIEARGHDSLSEITDVALIGRQ